MIYSADASSKLFSVVFCISVNAAVNAVLIMTRIFKMFQRVRMWMSLYIDTFLSFYVCVCACVRVRVCVRVWRRRLVYVHLYACVVYTLHAKSR